MGFWSRLFGRSSVTAGSGIFASEIRGAVGPGARRSVAQLLEAYGSVPRLYGNASRIARSVASVPWQLFRARNRTSAQRDQLRSHHRTLVDATYSLDAKAKLIHEIIRLETNAENHRNKILGAFLESGDLEPVPKHAVLDVINKPHPLFPGTQTRQLIQTYLDVAGESFSLVELAKDKRTPKELWPLPPTWVTEVPKITLGEGAGDIRRGKFTVNWFGKKRNVAYDRMLWFRELNISNPYGRGRGVGEVLNTELSTDEFASRTINHRFENYGVPDILFILKGLTDDQLKVAEQRYKQKQAGFTKAGRAHFTGADADVKTYSPSFVDMDVVNLRNQVGDNVRETFGTPPEIVGIIKNSNRATITSAQFLYAFNVLVPRLDVLEEYFNFQLVPMFPDSEGLLLLYVSPVPDDKEAQLEAAKTAPWALSLNEWRKRQGEDPVPGGDDLYMIPSGNGLATLAQAQLPQNERISERASGPAPVNGSTHTVGGALNVR